MLVALLLALIVLWLLGLLPLGTADFLRVRVFPIGAGVVTVLDLLLAVLVLVLMAAVRGPLAIACGLLLVLWAMTIAGVVAVQGVPLSTLIILVIIAGLMIHILTRRPT